MFKKRQLSDVWNVMFDSKLNSNNVRRHVISNNVVFWHVYTQTILYSLHLSLETPKDVQSVA